MKTERQTVTREANPETCCTCLQGGVRGEAGGWLHPHKVSNSCLSASQEEVTSSLFVCRRRDGEGVRGERRWEGGGGEGGEVTADSSRDVEHRGRAGPERERDKEITIKRNRQ